MVVTAEINEARGEHVAALIESRIRRIESGRDSARLVGDESREWSLEQADVGADGVRSGS